MYYNLKAEMVRKGLKLDDIARLLGIRRAAISQKMNGKSPFKYDEALLIKRIYFPDLALEYLFETNQQISA